MRFAIFISSAIPLFIVLFLLILMFASHQWNKITQTAQSSLDTSANNINKQLEILIKYNDIIQNQSYIPEIFTKEYESPVSALNAIYETNRYLQGFYNSYNGMNTDIRIYHNNYTLHRSTYSHYIEELNEGIINKVLELSTNQYIWINTNGTSTLYSNITTKTAENDIKIILAFPLSQSAINDIIYRNKTGYQAIISNTLPNNKSYLYFWSTLDNNQYISVAIPKHLKFIVYFKYLGTMILLFALFVVIILFTSARTSNKITKSLYDFIDYIKSDKLFLSTNNIEVDTDNEFKNLFDNITNLLDEINKSYSEIERLKNENTFLQMQHARYQINPHLLYNSLSTLKWECMKYNSDLPHKIDLLADYYRLSLKSTEENYTFKDEIDLIKKFINVISAIHNFTYNYKIELDERIYSEKTIQHIFQPFVENSILHGINRMKGGFIEISGNVYNNRIVFIIRDNGYGIPPEKLQNIKNHNDVSISSSGIGISNTIKRIKLYYGDNSVIDIDSEENKGTVISIEFDIGNSQQENQMM